MHRMTPSQLVLILMCVSSRGFSMLAKTLLVQLDRPVYQLFKVLHVRNLVYKNVLQ